MEFFDLKKQYLNLKPEIDAAVLEVLESGVFIGGLAVENFECAAAKFLGAEHALGLNSGTDALYLALKALGIKPGDEVIVPNFTFIATAEVVAQCGARPVFCDIDLQTFNINPVQIEKLANQKTKAVICVHLFGRAAPMAEILKICRQKGLFLIEDAAQAFGAKCGEKFCGTMGDIGCFSFFPTKNLGAFGDGGMIVADNDEIAAKLKLLRAHGSAPENKYRHLELGINSRLDALQAAILTVKLRHINEWNWRRIEIAQNYNNGLAGAGDIVLPKIGANLSCVFHQYAVRVESRDELQEFLKSKTIPTMVYYPIPLSLQPAFEYLGYQAGDFPVSEKAAAQILCLPIYPELEAERMEMIINSIKQWKSGK